MRGGKKKKKPSVLVVKLLSRLDVMPGIWPKKGGVGVPPSPFPSGSGCLVVSCSFYFSPMKAEQLLTASEVGDNMGTETKRLARLGFFCLFCFCYHCAVCSFACLFSVVFLWGGVVNWKPVFRVSSCKLNWEKISTLGNSSKLLSAQS